MSTMQSIPKTVGRPEGPPDPSLVQIRDLVYQVAGIFQPDNKLRFMEDRCVKRMQAVGVKSFREYYECLTIKPIRQAELISLLNEITVGETCFFRNQPQLDAIRNLVIPRIVEARAKMTNAALALYGAAVGTARSPASSGSDLARQVVNGPVPATGEFASVWTVAEG